MQLQIHTVHVLLSDEKCEAVFLIDIKLAFLCTYVFCGLKAHCKMLTVAQVTQSTNSLLSNKVCRPLIITKRALDEKCLN